MRLANPNPNPNSNPNPYPNPNLTLTLTLTLSPPHRLALQPADFGTMRRVLGEAGLPLLVLQDWR